MPEPFVTPRTAPDPIQRQRDALRSFRQADRARREAEAAAHKAYEQATSAADAAHQTARQNAENNRKQALAAAENRRQGAQGIATATLERIRNQAQEKMDGISGSLRTVQEAMTRENLDGLWPDGPTEVRVAKSAQSDTELDRRVQLAANVADQLRNTIIDYRQTLERDARQLRIIWSTILGLLVLVIVLLFLALALCPLWGVWGA